MERVKKVNRIYRNEEYKPNMNELKSKPTIEEDICYLTILFIFRFLIYFYSFQYDYHIIKIEKSTYTYTCSKFLCVIC